MKLSEKQVKQLGGKLPDWAVKQHPSKSYLSTINPMAVIDRLNVVFGVGGWSYAVEPVKEDGAFAVIKGTLIIPQYDIHLEQFGGNDNKDVGDAYKGASTDALTKIASYLGIGSMIYKGKGNVSVDDKLSEASAPTESDELNTPDWAKVRDKYLTTGVITPDDMVGMSRSQRLVINEIKKTFNQITRKEK